MEERIRHDHGSLEMERSRFPWRAVAFREGGFLDKEGQVFRSDVHTNDRQSSVSGIFEVKIDNPRSKDLTGIAKASADKTRRRISRYAQIDLVFASSQRVKCQMPCSRKTFGV